MEIILINEALFTENSPIKESTVITKFVPYLGIAQRLYIERILGAPLTEELKEQIKKASQEGATGEEITKDNQALILALAPALSFYAVYQGIPFHWAAIVNKGVTVQDSENSKAVDIKDIAQLRRWIRDDAGELANGLIKFLRDNRDKYPLWQPGSDCTDTEGSEVNPMDTGIYIPKRR